MTVSITISCGSDSETVTREFTAFDFTLPEGIGYAGGRYYLSTDAVSVGRQKVTDNANEWNVYYHILCLGEDLTVSAACAVVALPAATSLFCDISAELSMRLCHLSPCAEVCTRSVRHGFRPLAKKPSASFERSFKQ